MFGTLAAFLARGDEVAVAIATDGSKGGDGDPAELSRTRKAEATAAAKLVGTMPRFLSFPDGALVEDASLVGVIKRLITSVAPDLILTHAPNDYHGDHRAVSDAVRIAANFAAPVVWAETLMGVGFEPTHYVDVGPHFDTKLKAIREHKSQDPERFVEMVQVWNAFRALQCNAPGGYAEAFRFEPSYPFPDIRDLLPPAPRVRPLRARDRQAN